MNDRRAMLLQLIGPFVASARKCAVQMLENCMYVRQELPNVRMSTGLEAKVRAFCEELISAQHHLATELFKLQDAVEAGAESEEIARRLSGIVQAAFETLKEMPPLIEAVQQESEQDSEVGLAEILLTESAGNLLQAFVEMREAAVGITR